MARANENVEPNDIEVENTSSPSILDEVNSELTRQELGSRFRQIRLEHGFTLATLADKSGISLNTISMIENAKTSPSVGTLQQIARAMGIPIVEFFLPHAHEEKFVYTKKGQAFNVQVGNYSLAQLGKNYAKGAIQPFIMSIPENTNSGKKNIVHTGHEFVYCLAGSITYKVDQKSFLLESGDSLLFQAQLPHQWQNTGGVIANLLLVFIPDYSEDLTIHGHLDPINKEG